MLDMVGETAMESRGVKLTLPQPSKKNLKGS